MPLSRRNLLISAAAVPFAGVFCTLPVRIARTEANGAVLHALAMHGEPKYGPDFPHFDYVNPEAPKGGQIRLHVVGDTFATFNPFTLVNPAAAGAGFVFETLTTNSGDEAFTEYGLLAQTIEVPDDRSWVAFTLRAEARWHDGKPVTVEDVAFSFETLKTKGHPFYRAYYANVDKAEIVGERKVRFAFSGGPNRELPLIMGQLAVLPKHYWEGRDFGAATLEPPLGSGPYKISSFEAGRSVTLRRVEDYWGTNLPVNVGQYNWDTMRYEYFRDSTVALEAFKAGQYDFRQENNSKLWATGYDIPQVRDGRIVKEEIPNEVPTGMQGFAYNIRREIFKDPRVREALAYAFDFEWSNKTLFYGQYTRTRSYFSNSELASSGLPSREELEILERYRGRIPEEVFTTEYQPPATDGSGNIRPNLRKAVELLKSAGWEVKDGKLTHTQTGRAMAFEILLSSADFERVAQPFVQNLLRLGIAARIRTVDTAQYQNRMDSFDYDMTVEAFGQSLSPGNEQRDFWGSESADIRGGRNTIGIKDPVVDELVNLVIAASDRESLIARTRALDRVLLWGYYVIPHWHIRAWRVAYWNKFSHPKIAPKYTFGLNSWWVDTEKQSALLQRSN
jgi:microcin C transport system substrate-binding protein